MCCTSTEISINRYIVEINSQAGEANGVRRGCLAAASTGWVGTIPAHSHNDIGLQRRHLLISSLVADAYAGRTNLLMITTAGMEHEERAEAAPKGMQSRALGLSSAAVSLATAYAMTGSLTQLLGIPALQALPCSRLDSASFELLGGNRSQWTDQTTSDSIARNGCRRRGRGLFNLQCRRQDILNVGCQTWSFGCLAGDGRKCHSEHPVSSEVLEQVHVLQLIVRQSWRSDTFCRASAHAVGKFAPIGPIYAGRPKPRTRGPRGLEQSLGGIGRGCWKSGIARCLKETSTGHSRAYAKVHTLTGRTTLT